MKILTLHGDYFREPWERAGHEVYLCGDEDAAEVRLDAYSTTIEAVLARLGPERRPDVVFWADKSMPIRVLGLDRCPIPKVMWSIDAHHHVAWHALYGTVFDRVLVAQKDFLRRFEAFGVPARWLPLYAPDDRPAEPLPEPRHDVCFVGSVDPLRHRRRGEFLRELGERVDLVVAAGSWREAYARARIVLNQTVKGDLNFRVFEALCSGRLVLTERTGNGLLDLFADRVHLVTYPAGDVAAAAERIDYYCRRPEERERIARAGRRAVERHRRTARAAEVLACFAQLIEERAAGARVSQPGNDRPRDLGRDAAMAAAHLQNLHHLLENSRRLLALRGEPLRPAVREAVRAHLEQARRHGDAAGRGAARAGAVRELLEVADDLELAFAGLPWDASDPSEPGIAMHPRPD
jgi:hypothetical protein